MKKRISPLIASGTALGLLFCALAAFALSGLSDFEFKHGRGTALTFHSGNASLSGTLIMPEHTPQAPIALLIHGDGPRDRYAEDSYMPLINAFLDAA